MPSSEAPSKPYWANWRSASARIVASLRSRAARGAGLAADEGPAVLPRRVEMLVSDMAKLSNPAKGLRTRLSQHSGAPMNRGNLPTGVFLLISKLFAGLPPSEWKPLMDTNTPGIAAGRLAPADYARNFGDAHPPL